MPEIKEYNAKHKQLHAIRETIYHGQFQLALKMMNDFMEKYGLDNEILYNYGKILRKTGQVEKAIDTFKLLLNFLKEQEIQQYYDATNTELFKVYFINDYYKEAYDLLINNQISIDVTKQYYKDTPESTEFKKLLEIRLGIYQPEENESELMNKVLHYDKSKAIKHIKKHLEGNSTIRHSIFNDVDIDTLFTQVEKVLPNSQKMQRFSFYDLYIFNFSRVGQNDADLLKVVTNKGTYEIVAMYPTKAEYKGYINDNLYDEYLMSQAPQKTKSTQIDKFRNRYSKK